MSPLLQRLRGCSACPQWVRPLPLEFLVSAPVPSVAATTTPADPATPAAAPVIPVVPAAAADQGDEGKPTETPPAAANPDPATGAGDEPLGAPGVKALEAFKERAKTAEAEAKALKAERDEALAKLADAGLPEAAKALAAARREGETAATATVTAAATAALARQAVLAEAKGRLADPTDAVAFLNLADFKVGADFTVDATEIAAAVDGLLSRKPHLAVKTPATGDPSAPVVPTTSIDQGFREKDSPSLQDRIAAAEKAGNFAEAMALKSNQLFAALTARPT
jgi:hypothetical protein